MKQVFVDTFYWVATVIPGNQWHELALQAKTQLGEVHLITTEEVLTEFLTALAVRGQFWRQQAVKMVRILIDDETVTVMPQTHFSFLRGLELYASHLDKEYSLTDCISMNVMRDEGIYDILTNDHHFTQAGYNVLIYK